MEQKIEAVMTTKVVTATPATPFRELVELLGQRRISALPVVGDDRRVVGIVSEADLLIKEGWPHGGDDAGVLEALRHPRRFGKGAGTCAGEVMTRKVATVALGTPRSLRRGAGIVPWGTLGQSAAGSGGRLTSASDSQLVTAAESRPHPWRHPRPGSLPLAPVGLGGVRRRRRPAGAHPLPHVIVAFSGRGSG